MKKDRKQPDLQQESLQKNPFSVPEGYFEHFPAKLQARIRAEDSAGMSAERSGGMSAEESAGVPVRRLKSTRFRVAMAAALLGLALISYSILRFTAGTGSESLYPDMALMEELEAMEDDIYLYELLEAETEEMDDEEAFAEQAMNYLAMNDADMIFMSE